jgi:DNA-binding beta-propeller fold protein YncE
LQSLLKSIRISLFLGLWIVLAGISLPAASAKPSIAILELDAKGGITADEASIITDRLRAQLHQTGHFQILERAKMESVLKELGFQQSAFCDDSKCKAQIGKLLGVDGLVTGSVSRFDTLYTLSIRVLNVEKGVIIREEFQDCECPLKELLTQVTPQLVARLLSQKTANALPQQASSAQTATAATPKVSSPPLRSASAQPSSMVNLPLGSLDVQTLAGGQAVWKLGIQNGPALNATFQTPYAFVWDTQGQLLIADAQNHLVRKLSLNGDVSTFSGAERGLLDTLTFADGDATVAKFNFPTSMARHPSGQIYIVDTDNHRIRVMNPNGHVSTFVGTGIAGFADGNPAVAQFHRPRGIAIDSTGNVYVADTGNHSIRKISPNAMVSTLAGNGRSGFANGQGAQAQFHHPTALILHQEVLYSADTYNHYIRKITLTGEVTTIAGDGREGFVDGAAAQARFRFPRGLAFDSQGNLYIADTDNHRIRKYVPAQQQVITVAGNGSADFADGNAAVAKFNQPIGLLFDPAGHLLVADSGNNRIRKIIFQ